MDSTGYTESQRAADIADYIASLKQAIETRRPGDVDLKMMMVRWNVSETTARRRMTELVEEGKLTGPHRVQSETGKAVVWRLAENEKAP